MNRTQRITLSLIAASSLSASTALADAELEPGLTFTAVSGHSGSGSTDVGAASEVNAVSFLSAGERFDKPCELNVYKAEINDAGTSIFDDWDTCTTTSANKTVGWLNTDDIFVYGIAVCTNSSHDRLKGIQLFGGEVENDGTFTPLGYSDYFSRTNCTDWHTAVFCPAGQVATKVRVHHNGGDEALGLSLGCRVVIPM